jgi:hypothetical protein
MRRPGHYPVCLVRRCAAHADVRELRGDARRSRVWARDSDDEETPSSNGSASLHVRRQSRRQRDTQAMTKPKWPEEIVVSQHGADIWLSAYGVPRPEFQRVYRLVPLQKPKRKKKST